MIVTSAGLLLAGLQTGALRVDFAVRSQEQRCEIASEGRWIDFTDEVALKALIEKVPKTAEVRLIGDQELPYRCIGMAIYALQSKGIGKVAFISDPEALSD